MHRSIAEKPFPRRTERSDRRIDDARLRHLARSIYPMGPRPLFEMLRELDSGKPLHPTLERYAEISRYASFVRDMGGDRLDPQLRAVEGGRR
jgi:hypothetical protein